MGNKKDGQPHQKPIGEASQEHMPKGIRIYCEDAVEIYGNNDTKKLAQAYKEFSKGGLTADEKEKLKTLDKEAKGAYFLSMNEGATLVIQEDKGIQTDFLILDGDTKQNAGFLNDKPINNKPIRHR